MVLMGYPIAVGGSTTHEGGMSEKAQRRRFTAAYKLKVLQEADRIDVLKAHAFLYVPAP